MHLALDSPGWRLNWRLKIWNIKCPTKFVEVALWKSLFEIFPVLDYTDIFRSLITLRFSGPWLHWHFQVLDYTDIFRYLITLTFSGPWLHWYFQVLDYTEIFRSLITLRFSGPWLRWDFQVLDYAEIFRSLITLTFSEFSEQIVLYK